MSDIQFLIDRCNADADALGMATLRAQAKRAAAELAALEAVAEAAQKAEKELRRKLRDGETLHELIYRARQILTTALAALDASNN